MNTIKVTQSQGKGKSLCSNDFDHFLALDWSMKVMAIGHMRRRSKEPETFERPSDLKELKQYLERSKNNYLSNCADVWIARLNVKKQKPLPFVTDNYFSVDILFYRRLSESIEGGGDSADQAGFWKAEPGRGTGTAGLPPSRRGRGEISSFGRTRSVPQCRADPHRQSRPNRDGLALLSEGYVICRKEKKKVQTASPILPTRLPASLLSGRQSGWFC